MIVNKTKINLFEECTASNLIIELKNNHDFDKLFQNNFSIFVNGQFIKSSAYDTIIIKETDTVAIIPRLAGG